MRIRTALFSGLTAGVLLASGGAFAQSHQGGYLGLNPGANVATGTVQAPAKGSGQGGYLGLNAGANPAQSVYAVPSEQGSGQGGYLGQNPYGEPEQPR
jgi:hypothetical protein